MDNIEAIQTKVVIFSDALSVIQAPPKPPDTRTSATLAVALHVLRQSTEKTVIQWIPSHCNIPGKEETDTLAKEGGKLTQGK